MECLAVFIDAENISCSDYNQTEQRIRNLGTIIVNNVYADWSDSSIKNWLINARKIGLHTIQCDKISGKNSIDLKITVDMMKYLFTNDHITTFVIVSTDSDFRHVVTEIKSLNKKVICVGYDYANISLKSVCDQYIELYGNNVSNVSKWCLNFTEEKKLKMNKNENYSKYIVCINEFLNIYKSTTIAKLKNILENTFPEFDFKSLGFNKISDFFKDILSDEESIVIEGNDIFLINNM